MKWENSRNKQFLSFKLPAILNVMKSHAVPLGTALTLCLMSLCCTHCFSVEPLSHRGYYIDCRSITSCFQDDLFYLLTAPQHRTEMKVAPGMEQGEEMNSGSMWQHYRAHRKANFVPMCMSDSHWESWDIPVPLRGRGAVLPLS
jgi:hypothetical protein